jgi:hypothetical protein
MTTKHDTGPIDTAEYLESWARSLVKAAGPNAPRPGRRRRGRGEQAHHEHLQDNRRREGDGGILEGSRPDPRGASPRGGPGTSPGTRGNTTRAACTSMQLRRVGRGNEFFYFILFSWRARGSERGGPQASDCGPEASGCGRDVSAGGTDASDCGPEASCDGPDVTGGADLSVCGSVRRRAEAGKSFSRVLYAADFCLIIWAKHRRLASMEMKHPFITTSSASMRLPNGATFGSFFFALFSLSCRLKLPNGATFGSCFLAHCRLHVCAARRVHGHDVFCAFVIRTDAPLHGELGPGREIPQGARAAASGPRCTELRAQPLPHGCQS